MSHQILFVQVVCFSMLVSLASAQDGADPFGAPAKPPKVAAAPAKVAPVGEVRSAEEQIFEALDEKASIDFFEQPLTDVVAYLKDSHRINARLDIDGLDLAGVDPSEQVTCQLLGVSLRSALKILLANDDLTYVVKNEVLLITSTEASADYLSTKFYDVSDLVSKVAGDSAAGQIQDVVAQFVARNTWAESGGTGEISLLSFANDRSILIVNQQTTIHEEVSDFLEQLRGQAKLTSPKPDKADASED